MKIVAILLTVAVVGLGGFLLLRNKNTDTSLNNANSVETGTNVNQVMPADASVTAAREITIEANEFKFIPNEIRVKKGQTIKITLKNTGQMQHDWMVEKMGGASIDRTAANTSNSIIITPSQVGTFTTFCSVGNHRAQGMVGKLIVE